MKVCAAKRMATTYHYNRLLVRLPHLITVVSRGTLKDVCLTAPQNLKIKAAPLGLQSQWHID